MPFFVRIITGSTVVIKKLCLWNTFKQCLEARDELSEVAVKGGVRISKGKSQVVQRRTTKKMTVNPHKDRKRRLNVFLTGV